MITTKKIDPRPYQQKAAAAIHREWDAGNKKTLVVMPTGTGKTIVFASIVNDQVEKGEHVLILAHREELLQQASDKLKMVTGLETALEKAQSSALDSDKMVVVASVQTLSKQNRLMKYPRDYFGTIIIEVFENHHFRYPGRTWCFLVYRKPEAPDHDSARISRRVKCKKTSKLCWKSSGIWSCRLWLLRSTSNIGTGIPQISVGP